VRVRSCETVDDMEEEDVRNGLVSENGRWRENGGAAMNKEAPNKLLVNDKRNCIEASRNCRLFKKSERTE
jgi:hypothetical protein